MDTIKELITIGEFLLAKLLTPKLIGKRIEKAFIRTADRYVHGNCGLFALALYDTLKELGLNPKLFVMGYSSRIKGKKEKLIRVRAPNKMAPSYFQHVIVGIDGILLDSKGVRTLEGLKQLAIDAYESSFSMDNIANVLIGPIKREVIRRNMGEWKSLREFDESHYGKLASKFKSILS